MNLLHDLNTTVLEYDTTVLQSTGGYSTGEQMKEQHSGRRTDEKQLLEAKIRSILELKKKLPDSHY